MTTTTVTTTVPLLMGGDKDNTKPGSTMATSNGPNTRPYQSVQQLQSIRPTNQSITRDIQLTSSSNNTEYHDPSEERYWVEKFGLGTNASQMKQYDNTKRKRFANPRHVLLHVGTSSIVHQIIINTTAMAPTENVMYNNVGTTSSTNTTTTTTSNTSHYSKHTFMVGICGPRVPIYGTTPSSKIHRTLLSHNSNNTSSTIAAAALSANTTIIEPDRFLPMNGQLAICASIRNDGRLLVIGTMYGTIRITDTTTRMILCQYGASSVPSSITNAKGASAATIAPLPIRYVQWFRNGQYILCMGDDAIVRVWKLGANTGRSSSSSSSIQQQQQPVLSLSGHGDVIRCGALYQHDIRRNSSKNKAVNTEVSLTLSSEQIPITSIGASGSYDHTIRIWDMSRLEEEEEQQQQVNKVVGDSNNNRRCLHILYHGGPVETLLFVKSARSSSSVSSNNSTSKTTIPIVYLISGGGTNVKVWDAYQGTELNSIQLHHRKTITCMIAIPRIRSTEHLQQEHQNDNHRLNSLRIITGGLDGLMRVHTFDTTTGKLQFIHGIHITLPDAVNTSKRTTAAVVTNSPTSNIAITSLAATAIGDRIAIGTANGMILVCQKGIPIQPLKRTSHIESAGTYSFFTRGMNVDPSSTDTIVITNALGNNINNKKRKLANYDLALKQFRYSDALDEALNTRIPRIVVAVLEELGKRNGLTIALSNRNDEGLEPILSFLVRYITRPRYSLLLIGVTNMIISIYSEVSGQSEMIDELFMKLHHQILDEIRIQKQLFRVVGQIDATISTAAATTSAMNK